MRRRASCYTGGNAPRSRWSEAVAAAVGLSTTKVLEARGLTLHRLIDDLGMVSDREGPACADDRHFGSGSSTLGVVFAVLAGGVATPGCGGGRQADDLAAIPGTTMTTAATIGGETDGASAVFAQVAEAVPSIPIYGPAELPAGVTVADDWWPVLESEGPGTYQGQAVSNPRIQGGDVGDAQIQVVLQAREGWLVVLENFRGDLGEVSGEAVGEVDGHTATLYELNGGRLVQWSDSGRWYGVFGRDVAEELVVATALSMHLLSAAEKQ